MGSRRKCKREKTARQRERVGRVGLVLWSVLELMVFNGSSRSGGPGRCGAITLALSQLTDLNILEFHTPFETSRNSLNPQGTIVI